jgi:hypothetical protein
MMSKGIVVALISLAFLVQGVYGITVSSTQFKDGIANGISIDFNAGLGTTVNAEISSNPTIYMSGGTSSLNEHHQVTDIDGNHAEVNAVVTNAESITYSDDLSPEEGNLNYATGSVEAQQSVDVVNADLIKVSQSASNALLDTASSSIKIESGSLSNYHGFAYAEAFGTVTGEAISGQFFDKAEGSTVGTKEIASSHLGTSNSFADIVNGGIYGYVPPMGFGAMAVGDGGIDNGLMTMYMAQGGFSGDKVTVGSSAASSDRSKTSDIKTTIKNGGAYAYMAASGINFMGSPVVVSYQLYGVMGGTNVKITDAAFNAGNKASASMEVKNGVLYNLYDAPEDIALAGSISEDPSSSDVFTGGIYFVPVGVSADKLTLTASATNAQGVNAYKQTVFPSPNAEFINAAYTDAGNPYVNQEQVPV